MPRSFRQLNMNERRIVAQMLQAKARLAQIATVLGRSRSTVHREIKRNWWHDTEVPQADGYWHVTAQSLCEQRRRSYRKLHQHPKLCRHILFSIATNAKPSLFSGGWNAPKVPLCCVPLEPAGGKKFEEQNVCRQ
ncbi:helix-turn-helix domain-containing protein [Phyllobacterium sp. LjRoot231]|uniref:helix-turn-helix domain-containing protein n=1 Tax=Phyllobacterium sp. LjRoot231 TaxID=3342289 RepID=UPI003ED03B13